MNARVVLRAPNLARVKILPDPIYANVMLLIWKLHQGNVVSISPNVKLFFTVSHLRSFFLVRRPCENHACGPQSSCHDKDNGRSWVAECYCDSGYSVANGTCDGKPKILSKKTITHYVLVLSDSDECLSSPCPAHSTCANTQGSYVCTCDSTYLPENDVCGKKYILSS